MELLKTGGWARPPLPLVSFVITLSLSFYSNHNAKSTSKLVQFTLIVEFRSVHTADRIILLRTRFWTHTSGRSVLVHNTHTSFSAENPLARILWFDRWLFCGRRCKKAYASKSKTQQSGTHPDESFFSFLIPLSSHQVLILLSRLSLLATKVRCLSPWVEWRPPRMLGKFYTVLYYNTFRHVRKLSSIKRMTDDAFKLQSAVDVRRAGLRKRSRIASSRNITKQRDDYEGRQSSAGWWCLRKV